MRILCIILFFIASSLSLFSQNPHNNSDSSASGSDRFNNIDTSSLNKNNNADNPPNSSTDSIKTKISNAYKKLDNNPRTHKYIKQFEGLKGTADNTYKRLDSIKNAKITAAKANALLQPITKSLKLKKENRDSIKSSKLISSNSTQKDDTLFSSLQLVDLKTTEKQNRLEKIAQDYVNTGLLFLRLNKTREAITWFEKGLVTAKETHSLSVIQQALKGLSDAYSQKADIKKALFYYKQYSEIKDSLLELKTEQAIFEIKTKYEDEKKQVKIQSLLLETQNKKSELKKTQQQIKEQKQFILLIIVALLLTILLTITLFRQYRSKKKVNKKLLIQNDKIVEQKKELEESLSYTQQLQQALKEDLDHYMQAALRKQMNPHFIFNSLNSIQSFILQNDKLSANIYLSKFAGLMRKVLENSQHHLITLGKEVDVLKLYIELEEQRFDNKFNCIWNINSKIDLSAHKLPPLFLQPYIENAIWHGLLHKEGERTLTINMNKKNGILFCSIEDNGIGRTAAADISKNKSNHESLGTRITQKRIDLINSLNKSGICIQYYDLSDNNGLPNGTKVEITIPAID